MKKNILYFFALLSFNFVNAQKSNEPIEILGKYFTTNNYYEITAQLDNYWENKPNKDLKGSGYKVYQRWKEHWKYYLNEDGTLMSGDQIENQYLVTRKKVSNLSKTEDSIDRSNWIPMGPFTHVNKGSWSSGQGRINITVIDPQNPNTIYIGSPNGGIWKSNNHGNSWVLINENSSFSGVSGIAVDYNDSNIIYVSSGDEDGGNSSTTGIYKTINGGITWVQTTYPYNGSSKLGEILINPLNSNSLWVVGSSGIYKTTDAGLTWARNYNINCKEIRIKPNDTSVIYAVAGSGNTRDIVKSIDGGETFSIIQSFTNAGRTVIAVTPANAEYLYVLVSDNDDSYKGIYKSINSGETFTTQNTTSDLYDGGTQADYDLALTVSDLNPELIFTGCLNVWKSMNGGINFSRLNTWNNPTGKTYTHADIHDLKFYNGNFYVSSDGGIYISTDSSANFTDKTKNGLNISQFYRIDVAQSTQIQVVGGLQDNGGYSFANNAWINFHGADGMDAAIDPTDLNSHYGFIQYGGSMYKLDISNASNSGTKAVSSPAGEKGNWITPLEYGNNGILYAGFKKLYMYNSGTFNIASSYNFVSNINQIRVHPTNDLKVLVSTTAGLFQSDGTTEFNITKFNNLTSSIKNFDFNRNNPAIIYVVTDNIIYKSLDSGSTWNNITYNLPSGAKNSIIHQASSINNTIYLAMNKAVYYTNDSLNEWKIFSNNLPNTTINDIEVNNIENHVIISTYGRGIWRSPVVPSSLKIDNTNILEISTNNLVLFPNPTNDFAYINTVIDEPVVMNVYSISGQLILNTNYAKITKETVLDFTQLPAGTYVLNLVSEKHLITKKFIKN
jgi:photosystem II stability/assembly factor-like uncharacterized protein